MLRFPVQRPRVPGRREPFLWLNVSYSIFSNPENSPEDAALILQTPEKDSGLQVKYVGGNNVYHNLSSLLKTSQYDIGQDIVNFRFQSAADQGSDTNSLFLKLAERPWADSLPLQKILPTGLPSKAFQINQEMKEVRFGPRAVGIVECAWGASGRSQAAADHGSARQNAADHRPQAQ